MTAVVWKEPPPSRGSHRPPEYVEVLRANPGRWGVVAITKHPSTATSIKKRWGFETAARRMVDGRYEIYARQPAKPPEVTRVVGKISRAS